MKKGIEKGYENQACGKGVMKNGYEKGGMEKGAGQHWLHECTPGYENGMKMV